MPCAQAVAEERVGLEVKVRGIYVAVAAVLGCFLVFALCGGLEFVVPAVLGGGTSTLSVSVFVSLGIASAMAYAFDTRDTPGEVRAVRRVRGYDGWLFVAMLVAFSAAAGLGAFVSLGVPLQNVTSTVLLGSLAVIGACLVDAPAGALAATGFFLITSSYGAHLRGASMVRVLHAEANPAIAVVLYGRRLTSRR